jgi:hypothetical protein
MWPSNENAFSKENIDNDNYQVHTYHCRNGNSLGRSSESGDNPRRIKPCFGCWDKTVARWSLLVEEPLFRQFDTAYKNSLIAQITFFDECVQTLAFEPIKFSNEGYTNGRVSEFFQDRSSQSIGDLPHLWAQVLFV